MTAEQRQALAFPEASALVQAGEGAWRVHWISAGEWSARAALLERRLALQLDCMPAGRVIEDGPGRWLAFDVVPRGTFPWEEGVPADAYADLPRLASYVDSLAIALETLHRQELVWLRFDPNALEDVGELPANSEPAARRRLLRFTNLDIELFPFRAMPERVRVHPQYAAPEVMQFRTADIGPRTDVFHLAAFTYYWLARMLPDGMPGDGLEQFDYDMPFLRIYAPLLPTGILPIVERGLSVSPRARHESPRQFAAALAEGIDAACRRRDGAASLRWDIGGHTRAGRAKGDLRRVNEDTIFIKEFDNGAVVAVADGVSTCDIGTGALASMMTTIVLENAFADGCTHETFQEQVSRATRTGSQGLLEWALARGNRAELEAGKDLMGTTLTVGWLEGRDLNLANLGDSRAYLVTADAIEQLTVDGDLASDLLAQGASPQEVRELGSTARALRECVGGCTKTEDGALCTLPDSANPRVTRWPLCPGDTLVICSDGLVEEGFFLEPKTVYDIVQQNRNLPAAELALRLADAADALQRTPSMLEPDGFGDNISCIVVKISD